MKHTLQIRVSKGHRNGGVLACRHVTVRERFLRFLHTQPNRKLFDVMTKGSGDARMQPLFFLITTAGNDTQSICYEQHQKALDIMNGRKHDPTFYPVIFGADESEDWTDPKVWKHTLLLYYPIEDVTANYTNTFNVYLRMSGGTGNIEIGGIIASISGQAMAAEEAWDGKLEFEESVKLFAVGANDMKPLAFSETMEKQLIELVQRSYSDTVTGRTAIGAFCMPIDTN